MGRFRIVLSARVFVEIFESIRATPVSSSAQRYFNMYDTYDKPRCDETNLRSDRPISISLSEDSGFRHSISKS